MRGIGHVAREAEHVFLINQLEETLATMRFKICRIIPGKQRQQGRYGQQGEAPQQGKEVVTAQQQIDTGHAAGQNDSHRSLGEGCSGHQRPGQPGNALQAPLGPAVERIERQHDEGGQQHVDPAGISGAVHLKAGEREQPHEQGHLHIAPPRVEHEAAQYHHPDGKGRRQTGRVLADSAGQRRNCGHAPVEERRLEGDFVTVVDGQHPVAVLQHGIGHDGLAGFAAGVEERIAQKDKEGKAAQQGQQQQCLLL